MYCSQPVRSFVRPSIRLLPNLWTWYFESEWTKQESYCGTLIGSWHRWFCWVLSLPVITAAELTDAASEAVNIKHAHAAKPTRRLVAPVFSEYVTTISNTDGTRTKNTLHISEWKCPSKCNRNGQFIDQDVDRQLNPLMGTLKPQSNGPLCSNTVIGTLAVDVPNVTKCCTRPSKVSVQTSYDSMWHYNYLYSIIKG